MNWKIILLFCCALYCVSGKSVLRQDPQNFKDADDTNDIDDMKSSEEDINSSDSEKNPHDGNTDLIKKNIIEINDMNRLNESGEIEDEDEDEENKDEIANHDEIDGNNVDKNNDASDDSEINSKEVAADDTDEDNTKIGEDKDEIAHQDNNDCNNVNKGDDEEDVEDKTVDADDTDEDNTKISEDKDEIAHQDNNDGNNVNKDDDEEEDVEDKAVAADNTNGSDNKKVGETQKESIINNVDNKIEDSEKKYSLPNFGNIENLAKETLQNIAQASFSNSDLKKMMQQFPAFEIDKLAEKISNAVDFFSQKEQDEEKFDSNMNDRVFEDKNQEASINDDNMNDYMETIQRDQGMIDKNVAVLAPDYQEAIKSLPKLFSFMNSKISAEQFQNPEPVQIQKDEPKVGFGAFGLDSMKLKFGSLTEYMKKTVANAKTQLKKLGPRIESKNPPLHINEIPGTLITLKLKYVEGASSLFPSGDSRGIYYNKMYAFTQFKFEKLKYYYDVEIKPLGLFTISSKMSITLYDALAKMHATVEKSKQMRLLNFEFLQSKVYIDYNGNAIMSYALNYIINNVHPVVKKKVTEIVSRDSKLMLEDFIRGAQ